MLRCAFVLLLASGVSPCAALADRPLDDDRPAAIPHQPAYRQALDDLHLPADPTAAHVTAYLAEVARLTGDQTRHTGLKRTDPQQAMLQGLADDHMDQLIAARDDFPVLRYYLLPIIREEINRRAGPDLDALQQLDVPTHSQGAAVLEFLDRLEDITENQHRLGKNDPQITLLIELATHQPQAVIDALDRPSLRYHATRALKQSITSEQKALVIDALEHQPRLIGLVVDRGWEADARDHIIQVLANDQASAPWVWTSALARLEDPATYDVLRHQLVRTRCNRAYYELLHDLPGINLDAAVAQAWRRVQAGPLHERELRNVSLIAVRHGHAEALGVLIQALPTGDDAVADSTARQTRRAVMEHTGVDAENRDLKDWWEQHRDAIDFNPQTQQFYVASGLM